MLDHELAGSDLRVSGRRGERLSRRHDPGDQRETNGDTDPKKGAECVHKWANYTTAQMPPGSLQVATIAHQVCLLFGSVRC
jgi:hypothetical protein